MKIYAKNKGFSLVEMLIYVSVLSIVIVTIVAVLFTLTKSHRAAQASKQIQSNALFAIDRITKDIHNATSVDIIKSLFGSNPGKLVLNTTDMNGNAKTVEYFVQDGVLQLNENGIYSGQITSSSTYISNLVFRHVDHTKADAVKLEMQITGGEGEYAKAENFYTTVILRNSY